MRAFAIPPALLDSLRPVDGSNCTITEPSANQNTGKHPISTAYAKVSRKSAANPSSISKLGCQLCAVVSFDTVQEQRLHFQSDWHLHNLQMKRQGSPAGYCTSHQEFLAISGERKQEEDDGDASDWSLHDKSSADDMSDSSVNGSKSLVPIGSQFQYFKSETERCHFKVYRTILSGAVDKDPIAALRGLQLSNSAIADDLKPYWTIVMLSGGHFAGAVFDNRSDDGKMVDHCTIHRYVTRRKQGGSQSKKDQQGRKPKSAGATLRRYNQQQLEQDVQDVMQRWKEFLSQSQLVFYHAPGQYNRNILFSAQGWPSKEDGRLGGIPFTTYRPTLEELWRIYDRLSTVRLLPD